MPSHPDRVRRNNCPKHNWKLYPGVHKCSPTHFVLDGYKCSNCNTIISRNEYEKLAKK